MRVNLQPAYVVHSRPYRDTSAILEVFTAEHGRISLIARGARRQSRKGSSGALLQPFKPLLISFSGRAELKTLVATESVRRMPALRSERLYSGMYINELLVRLLHRNDAHPELFAAYDAALDALAGSVIVDTILRRFEITLLNELGYSLNLGLDGASGEPVEKMRIYRYDPDFGLVETDSTADGPGNTYSGADLLSMASDDFEGAVRLSAKRLLREALAVHLGDEPLHSRRLFRAKVGTARESQAT